MENYENNSWGNQPEPQGRKDSPFANSPYMTPEEVAAAPQWTPNAQPIEPLAEAAKAEPQPSEEIQAPVEEARPQFTAEDLPPIPPKAKKDRKI